MGRLLKLQATLLAAALLALGVAACGGGGGSAPSTGATAANSESGSESGGGGAGPSAKQGGGEKGGPRNESEPESGGGANGSGGGAGSVHFVSKRHHDSGGGSAQFKAKGGDNSVQEFGVEAGGSEFDEAAAALHNFLDARSQGAWAAACDYLSSGAARSLEMLVARGAQGGGTSCATALSKLANPAATDALRAEAAKADVGSVRIEGNRGFALYTFGGTVYAILMSKEGGAWKVASLAGLPLS